MIKKHWIFLSFVFIIIILVSLFFWPAFSRPFEVAVLMLSIVAAILLTINDHWRSYIQAECTREKMTRNLTFDLLRLLPGMAAAIFAGGMAGQWAGMQAGLWAGLAAGFLVGFLAAWVVRSMWGKFAKVGA